MERQIVNPHPPSHPHLRRAFEEGVRAARRQAQRPHVYSCETKEENLAWLDGFMLGREQEAASAEAESSTNK